MSARLLKKVLKEQEQKLQQKDPQHIAEEEEEDVDGDEEDQKLNSGSSINPFGLLDDDDGRVSDQVSISPHPDSSFYLKISFSMFIVVVSSFFFFPCTSHFFPFFYFSF